MIINQTPCTSSFTNQNLFSSPKDQINPKDTFSNHLISKKDGQSFKQGTFNFGSAEIDNIIKDLSMKYRHDWKKISIRVKSLTKKTISPTFLQKRYHSIKNITSNSFKKPFDVHEDKKLLRLAEEWKYDWTKISKQFHNRNYTSLKNRFYYLMRKKRASDNVKMLIKSVEHQKNDSKIIKLVKNNKHNDINLNTLVKDLELPENLKILDGFIQ